MSHHSHHPLRAIALLAGALVLLTGCGHTILERIDSRTSMRQLRRSALTENEASEHTLQIVRRLQLEKVYRKTPKKALAALAERLRASGDRETAFALSELAFLHVRRGHLSNADGRTYTTSAARYAHACLFDASLGPFFSEFDPRFRLAADLYNQSLAQLARLWRDDDYDPRWFQGEVGMVGGAATVVASERVKGLEKELKRSRLAFDYRIDAFANRRRRFGLGLPLVVPESEAGAPQSELIRQAGVRAASLFVSFSGSARKPHTVATVRLYDAIDNPSFEEGRRRVPLEADFTAPLAYILQERRQFLGLTAIRRVLRGDAVAEKRGLYLFQPYRSDRIPVVMVHGLMS